MCHKRIRIPRESANEIMRALGNLENSIEFVDLTKDDIEAKKNFGSMLKRCEEMNAKILDLETVCGEFHQPLSTYSNYQEFSRDLQEDIKNRDKVYGSTYFDLVEAEVIENDKKIKELVDSHTQIREDLVNLIEKKHVLAKTRELLFANTSLASLAESDTGENGIKSSATNLNFMAGVVQTNEELKMKRMIFRVSRGRAITTFYNLNIDKEEYLFTSSIRQRGFSFAEGPNAFKSNTSNIQMVNIKPMGDEYNDSPKKIFNIIFQGGEENILLGKILKVCEIFQASRYNVPKNSEIQGEVERLEKEIGDKKDLLIRTEMNLRDILLKTIAYSKNKNSKFSLYKLFFLQEKMVYATLNKCILRDAFIDGEVWIPRRNLDTVSNILQNVFSDKDNKLTAQLSDVETSSDIMPPTYIPSNDFIWAFQQIVSTYGTPRYREINPAFFCIVTFPFLFGVMFGDIGHGLILFLFSLYLCLFKESIEKSDSFLKMILKGRYLLLLMGFFGFFCGLMYNDFLSVPLDFTSCYEKVTEGPAKQKENCVYSFGLDPKWYSADNELTFINSMKMKLSVILGVAHMAFGIILKGFNCIFERKWVDFIFVFIPEIILLLILFGYMDFLIIIKWNTNYTNPGDATDIKSLLMEIFLKPGNEVKNPLWGTAEQMRIFHLIILAIVGVCVILMLIPKTILDYSQQKKKYQDYLNNNNNYRGVGEPLVGAGEVKPMEEPKFSDALVHTVIETIEFVLGTVSNTASYLRLWALSLAHSQLSEVFFDYGIKTPSTMTQYMVVNMIILLITYIFFAYVTFGVLLLMDLMECFLHTLRLHWVEFQNKFYRADGYDFKPFCFRQALNVIEETANI